MAGRPDFTEKEGRFQYVWVQCAWGAVTAFSWLFFLLFSVNGQGTEAVVAVCALGVLVLLAAKYGFGNWFHPSRATPWILFLLCLASRLAYCSFMEPRITQVSDFGVYLQIAHSGDYSGQFFHFFPHKAMYPVLLRLLGILTQEKAFFFQCLCVSGIPPLLYRMGTRLKNEKNGMLAAMIYLVWPGQFAYTAIVSEEHLVALILVAIVSLLLDIYYAIMEREKASRSIIIKSICAGLLCGVCALFRDYGIIILIASALCGLVLLPGCNAKQRKRIILVVILLFLTRTTAQKGIAAMVSSATGLDMKDNTVAAHMFWSLDPNGWGGWSEEGAAEYFEIAENCDNDINRTNVEAMRILFGKLQAGWHKLPNLFLKKGTDSYSNDAALFYWLTASIRPEYQTVMSDGFGLWESVGQTFYLAMVLCLLLCTIFRKKEIFFILLFTVGAVAVQMLIESQGRYKYVVEPLWCLTSAWALYALTKKVRKTAGKWLEISQESET